MVVVATTVEGLYWSEARCVRACCVSLSLFLFLCCGDFEAWKLEEEKGNGTWELGHAFCVVTLYTYMRGQLVLFWGGFVLMD